MDLPEPVVAGEDGLPQVGNASVDDEDAARLVTTATRLVAKSLLVGLAGGLAWELISDYLAEYPSDP